MSPTFRTLTAAAALCAVTALSFLSDTFKTYGDVEGGFLLVPAVANRIILA